MYLIKTDLRGNLIWQRTFGNDQNEYAYAVEQSHKGVYILVGYTENQIPQGDDVKLTYVLDHSEVDKMSEVMLINYMGTDKINKISE